MSRRPFEPVNLWSECERRNRCCYGLPRLSVRLDTGGTATIRGTFWDRHTKLVVILDDGNGTTVPAESCTLLERWPVTCCRPSRSRRRPPATATNRGGPRR